jgi:hypothetical protein
MPGEMQRTMECEELVHPLVEAIVSAAAVSGWTIDETLVAVEEAVKDIRAGKDIGTAKPAA